MNREHPLRDAAIALTTLTAIPTPATWLSSGPVQAAGWFPVIGGLVGAVGYGVVKFAEAAGVLQVAPIAVASFVVVVWIALTWGLHWQALTSVIASLLGRTGLRDAGPIAGGDPNSAPGSSRRTRTIASGIVALLAAGETVVIGSFLVMHQSPVLCIPLLARFAATAAAWLGNPVATRREGRALFGRPTALSAAVAIGALALATFVLWTGFHRAGLLVAGFGVLTALAVPHLLSLLFDGVTLDVLEASVVLAEIVTFIGFALFL